MRKVIMLESMFKDIATRQESLVVDELYNKGAKGSAIVFMTKRVKRQWDRMLGKDATESSIEARRVIRINEGGHTRVEALG